MLAPRISCTRATPRSCLAVAVLWFAVCAPTKAHAIYDWEGDDSSASLLGSAKLFPAVMRMRGVAGTPAQTTWSTTGSLRLSLDASTQQLFALEAAYHIFPTIHDDTAQSGSFGALSDGLVQPRESDLRLVDMKRTPIRRDRFTLEHNLDRLNLALMLGTVELRVGRQAIGHGSARIFTSTDIFSPFSPATLDSEFKQGIDALRATLPVGEETEFELLAVGHRARLRDGIFFGHARHSFPGLDLSAYGGLSYRAPTVGLDLSGDLFDATLYAELFYRHWSRAAFARTAAPRTLALAPSYQEHTVRATAGIHYYFESGLSSILEFHYNGSGASNPSDYFAAALAPEWQAGESFLLGRYYVGLGLNYELTELVSAGFTALGNLRDPSALLGPSLIWNSSDNTSVGVGGLIGLGRGLDALTPRSEFGLYPYTVYADARWYF